MNELVAPDDASSSDFDFDAGSDPAAAVTRIRDRAERVRRRELETALGRLAADGEVTPAERRILARLSVDLTDALVDGWVGNLDDGAVAPEAAVELLVPEE